MILRGIPVAPGRAAGRVWVWRNPPNPIQVAPAGDPSPSVQLVRLENALRDAESLLKQRRADLSRQGIPSRWIQIIDAHLAMLRDPMLIDEANHRIAQKNLAEDAVIGAADHATRCLRAARRAANREDSLGGDVIGDIRQVRDRILRSLGHPRALRPASPQERLERPAIIVAQDIAPEDLLTLAGEQASGDRQATRMIRAMCLDQGGALTHASIIARHLGIPTVVGMVDLSRHVENGEAILVDGTAGSVVLDPSTEDLAQWRWARHTPSPTKSTPDLSSGPSALIYANLQVPEEGRLAMAQGADGIGLLRSDGMRKQSLSEVEQAACYRDLFECMGNLPVTIRMHDAPAPGPNPALGIRGVRWLTAKPHLIQTQLRAICMAAQERRAHSPVRVLLPMVTTLQEIDQVRTALRIAWRDTCGRADIAGIPTLGAMLETPAAALIASSIAQAVDFVAVGTNDLLQLTLAVDREDARLAELLNPEHPAFIELLNRIAEATAHTPLPSYVCGALAADPTWSLRLLAMGFRALSVPPPRIQALRNLTTSPTNGALE